MRRVEAFALHIYRFLAETAGEEHDDDGHDDDDHGNGADGHSEFGVHITYEDLYRTVIFLTCIYVSGQIASRFLRMPNLVGEIVAGILLGPPLADFVPNPASWVLLGELGLILLVLEAGIDIDLSTLKLIGTRGFLIAFFGSLLPIGLGMLIAYLLNVTDTKGVIAAGAVFGPTSLGIALNILRGGGILNTPVGQLIISAAVIDDMIALVILSMLEVLTSEVTVAGIVVPIASALAFLLGGGYIAVFIVPILINKHILVRFKEEHHDRIEMAVMIFFLLVLMPATYYSKASYLMGAFIAGLAFCSSHGLHTLFVRQFKRILQWLMRIFFAASIGFQVPIKDFADGEVVWQGLVFTFALLGKLAVGFMVPNFTKSRRFTGNHLRDCLITGFSMAAEGEFAFVLAVFAVEDDLISKDLYASVVLAVLLSTIIPPFLLRFTIAHYNKKGEEAVERAAEEEEKRKHDLDTNTLSTGVSEDELVQAIKNQTTVFLCIQTQSNSKWGLLHSLMDCMAKKELDVIDHRAWWPRGVSTTLVNEVYARTTLNVKANGGTHEALEALLIDIQEAIEKVINQPSAKVKVQRWFPGVVEEIVEEVNEKSRSNVTQRLLKEASCALERKQQIQTLATKEKTVAELLGTNDVEQGGVETEKEEDKNGNLGGPTPEESAASGIPAEVKFLPEMSKIDEQRKPRRRVRQKMRSTPVVGGGLFGEVIEAKSGREGTSRISDYHPKREDLNWNMSEAAGVPAEIAVKGESFNIRISRDTWKDLQKGFNGQMVDSRGIEIAGVHIAAKDDAPVVQRLQGFVRHRPLNKISEEHPDEVSEISGDASEQKGV